MIPLLGSFQQFIWNWNLKGINSYSQFPISQTDRKNHNSPFLILRDRHNSTRDAHGPAVDPRYTAVGESLRQNVPHEMQCSMFCGGRKCKYEGADNWRKEDMTVKGIFR